jgi:hypothetical protein
MSADALLRGSMEEQQRCARELQDADLVAFVGVSNEGDAAQLSKLAEATPCVLAHGCAAPLMTEQRLHFQPAFALAAALAAALPWCRANRDALLLEQAGELLARKLPHDFVFALLLLLDSAVAPVTTSTMKARSGPGTLLCMARHCRTEVLDCVSDPRCKAALDCLTGCGLNDQVCSYRCIVSYESQKFEAFSLCVMQRHNCLGNMAQRPVLPAIEPMAAFRGVPLTHDTAESLLAGWLRGAAVPSLAPPALQLDWSWRVVAGQNPAFDHFPAQHQMWYKIGRNMFYDPVFKVRTLSGEWEWRRRHYRVRRGEAPGRFIFSVLDNGVTSTEHWSVIDVADDLSWGLFAYSGAAAAAGQAYSGAVFATPSGQWPPADQLQRVKAAHAAAGIEMFECFTVDNSPEMVAGAPLSLAAEAA